MQLIPRNQRGRLTAKSEIYGYSVLGAPLIWFPAPQPDSRSGLVIAGTHGDENSAIITLSCALRSLEASRRHHHVVLAINPDGCQLGLRANARGVDINRNFPASNWQKEETVYRWSSYASERDVLLSTGNSAGSEPETGALCSLIEKIKPQWVVSLHEPLGCIDDPLASQLGQWLSKQMSLPLVTGPGYETNGSFGNWCKDIDLPCITVEFPAISANESSEKYLAAMVGLLGFQGA